MSMRMRAILSAAGTVALVAGLGATPSFAATAATWTISPGGTVTMTQSGRFTLTDTVTKTLLSCHTKGTGQFKSGSGLSGSGIGAVTLVSFSNCTGPSGFTFTMTPGHFPWPLSAVTYNPAITAGTTTGTISGIHATLSGKNCKATVDGTGATANDGTEQIHYHNSLAKLKILTQGSNLHFYNVTGCTGLISSGDAATIASAYHIAPAQTISSP